MCRLRIGSIVRCDCVSVDGAKDCVLTEWRKISIDCVQDGTHCQTLLEGKELS